MPKARTHGARSRGEGEARQCFFSSFSWVEGWFRSYPITLPVAACGEPPRSSSPPAPPSGQSETNSPAKSPQTPKTPKEHCLQLGSRSFHGDQWPVPGIGIRVYTYGQHLCCAELGITTATANTHCLICRFLVRTKLPAISGSRCRQSGVTYNGMRLSVLRPGCRCLLGFLVSLSWVNRSEST